MFEAFQELPDGQEASDEFEIEVHPVELGLGLLLFDGDFFDFEVVPNGAFSTDISNQVRVLAIEFEHFLKL